MFENRTYESMKICENMTILKLRLNPACKPSDPRDDILHVLRIYCVVNSYFVNLQTRGVLFN